MMSQDSAFAGGLSIKKGESYYYIVVKCQYKAGYKLKSDKNKHGEQTSHTKGSAHFRVPTKNFSDIYVTSFSNISYCINCE